MELNQYIELSQPFVPAPNLAPLGPQDHSEQTSLGMAWAARQAERVPEPEVVRPAPNPSHFPVAS